jgi:succinate dehydrogenase / fumarate reductase cytochrome b subunit
MGWLVRFLTSSIGAKVLMALTGVVLVGFIIGHLAGNLQLYAGQDTLNDYAELLQSKPLLLWLVRTGLLASFLLHVVFSARLTLLNRQARPVAYASYEPLKSSFSSRNMFVTGAMVLAFLIYHLLHFTLLATGEGYEALVQDIGGGFTRPDVYSMVVLSFQNLWVSLVYIAAMVLLGLHLSHAVSSMFQSLGLNSPRFAGTIEKIGPALAVIVVAGNISMPVAVLLGWIGLPGGGMP